MCGPWERRKRNADEAKKRNQNDKGLGCPRIDKVHASQGALVGFGKGIVGWRVTEGGFGGGLLKEEGGMACRNGPPTTAAVTRLVLRCLSVGAICAYPLAPWHRATGGDLEEGGGAMLRNIEIEEYYGNGPGRGLRTRWQQQGQMDGMTGEGSNGAVDQGTVTTQMGKNPNQREGGAGGGAP